MNRATLWSASLMMVALTTMACGQDQEFSPESESSLASKQAELASLPKALILGSTVVGGANSVEAQAALRLGLEPVVVGNAAWAAMTPSQFSEYRVIVLGDANCANLDVASAAVANRWVWGGVINGNVLIAGTAPVANGAPAMVTEKAIKFASAEMGLTGLYVSLSCYYQNALPNTSVQLLEAFGEFSVQSGGCHNTAHIVGRHSVLNTLTDSVMSNWACSVGTKFESFPTGNFVPWSVARYGDASRSSDPGVREFVDGSFGAPYILARGANLLGCGNYEQDVGEACDFGIESNGIPEAGCSTTCQLSWCGDGIVGEGEDCDEGYNNGFGACPMSCRIGAAPPPPPENRPPVARCRPVGLSAGPSCGGVSASINDGSSDPDGNLVGCVQSVTSFELGSTLATLTCTDAQGLTASCTAPVLVVDDSAPSISCPAPSTFECGGGVSAQVSPAQAQDNCMAPVMSYTMSGDSFTLGTPRTVTWVAADESSQATCSTTMTMVDTLAPSISLTGAAQQQLECGVGSYTEAGYTASDACAGSLSSRVAISGQVNAAAVGNYTVSYSVADNAGHSASAVRTVSVRDTLAPSISLVGAQSMRLECAVDSFTNPGATAVDACSGALTPAITSNNVNTAAVGNYSVTYRAEDRAGLSATAVRTVQVADTRAPSIALNGASTVALECGVGSYTEAGATASDVCTGDLSNKVAISGTVNTAARGTYVKSYSVADASGNVASAARTVNVLDTRPPSIALVGAQPMRLECGVDSFVNPGATAVDACSGVLTPAITSNNVNAAAVGNYSVTYSVADGAGLSASAVREVQVADTRAPSISLVGAANMSVVQGGSFVDPGATASDICSGSLTSAIVRTGTVNTSAAGTYTLTYSVQDGAGLSASVSRTVTVTGPTCNTTINIRPTQQIWPPNHHYQTFTLADCASVTTTTTCGGGDSGNPINTMGTITSIYSDEVEDAQGNGDGHTVDDIVITGPSSFKVRAERQGKGNGRFYGVNFQVTDSAGNTQTATCKFVVPHDQSGRGAIDNGAAAGYTVNAPNW